MLSPPPCDLEQTTPHSTALASSSVNQGQEDRPCLAPKVIVTTKRENRCESALQTTKHRPSARYSLEKVPENNPQVWKRFILVPQ